MPIKIVLDSNTIISGLLWMGNELELLRKIEDKNAMLFVTQPIIEEIDEQH